MQINFLLFADELTAGTYGSSFAGGKITASFLGCDVATISHSLMVAHN